MIAEQTSRTNTAPKRNLSFLFDGLCVFALFCAGVLAGITYIDHWGGQGQYFQKWSMPAVTLACGRGFVDVPLKDAPKVAAFLEGKAETCSCEDLPAVLNNDDPKQFKSCFQQRHQYLLYAESLCFRIWGIRWRSIVPLNGLMCGLGAGLSFLFFRLGMHRVLAVFSSIILLASPVHLSFLPQLRDYSKLPFFLAVWVMMAWWVKKPIRGVPLLISAAILGLVMGIGLGFRDDMLLLVMPVSATLLLFLPGPIWEKLPLKITALLLCLACLIVTGYPILQDGQRARWHNVLLGFGQPFDRSLGIDASDVYHFEPLYSDRLQMLTTSNYAKRILQTDEAMYMASPAYDAAGKKLFFERVRTFPADLITRSLSALRYILNHGPCDPSFKISKSITQSFLLAPYHLSNGFLRLFEGWGWIAALSGVFVLSLYRLRWGLYSLVFMGFFCGYTCLQFDARHWFHTIVIPLWFFGFLLHQLISAGILMASREQRNSLLVSVRRPWPKAKPMLLAAGLIFCVAGLVAGSLWACRFYQQKHVGRLLERYASAPMVPLEYDYKPINTDDVLIQPRGLVGPPPPGIRSEYFVLDIECPRTVPVTFRFTATDNPRQAPTYTVNLASNNPVSGTPNVIRYMSPIYTLKSQSEFVGLSLRKEDAPLIRGLYKVTDLQSLPLLLYLTFTPAWRDATLYQTLP